MEFLRSLRVIKLFFLWQIHVYSILQSRLLDPLNNIQIWQMSWAVVTPVKYECYIQKVIRFSMILKKNGKIVREQFSVF